MFVTTSLIVHTFFTAIQLLRLLKANSVSLKQTPSKLIIWHGNFLKLSLVDHRIVVFSKYRMKRNAKLSTVYPQCSGETISKRRQEEIYWEPCSRGCCKASFRSKENKVNLWRSVESRDTVYLWQSRCVTDRCVTYTDNREGTGTTLVRILSGYFRQGHPEGASWCPRCWRRPCHYHRPTTKEEILEDTLNDLVGAL